MGQVLAANSNRLAFIDCWRAVAVVLVILGHLRFNHDLKALSDSSPTLHFFSDQGQIGVFIFFFISGYVVSKACLTETHSTGNFSILAFYIRRVFRIVPPLLIYLTTCLALGYLSIIDFTMAQFLPSAFYVCNNNLVGCGWFAAHTWSLAFEEQFYLIFPLLFALVHAGRRPYPIALILAVSMASIPLIWPINVIGRTGFLIIYSLFILGYIFARKGSGAPKTNVAVSCIFVASTIVTFLPAGDLMAFLVPGAEAESKFLAAKYYKFIFIVSVPLMVMSTGVAGTVLNNILGNKAVSYFGRTSYSVYLWQQLATGTFPYSSASMQIAVICIMVAGCMLHFELVEKRLVRLGRGLASSWSRSHGDKAS